MKQYLLVCRYMFLPYGLSSGCSLIPSMPYALGVFNCLYTYITDGETYISLVFKNLHRYKIQFDYGYLYVPAIGTKKCVHCCSSRAITQGVIKEMSTYITLGSHLKLNIIFSKQL